MFQVGADGIACNFTTRLQPCTCTARLLQGILVLLHRLQATMQESQLLQLQLLLMLLAAGSKAWSAIARSPCRCIDCQHTTCCQATAQLAERWH
jgi:hypothetical protein